MENLTQLVEALVALVGLLGALAGVAAKLYAKQQKEKATFYDLVSALDDAVDIAEDFIKSGKAKDLEEGAQAGLDLLGKLNDAPLPSKVAGRLKDNIKLRLKARAIKETSK